MTVVRVWRWRQHICSRIVDRKSRPKMLAATASLGEVTDASRVRNSLNSMTNRQILLADDHPVVCSGLRVEIAKQSGWIVIGQAATGLEAVRLARKLEPDLLILDLRLPSLDGIAVIESVLQFLPAVKIVVFTDDGDPAQVEQALRAGASGYVLKSSAVADLLEAIGKVLEGRMWVSPQLRAGMLENYRGILTQPPGRTGPMLSEKERMLLRLLAAGKRSKEMAPSLNLSLSSVDTYRLRIKRKLGCQSTAELVRYAIVNRIAEL